MFDRFPKTKPEFFTRARNYLLLHAWVGFLIVLGHWVLDVVQGAELSEAMTESDAIIAGISWLTVAGILWGFLLIWRRSNQEEFS